MENQQNISILEELIIQNFTSRIIIEKFKILRAHIIRKNNNSLEINVYINRTVEREKKQKHDYILYWTNRGTRTIGEQMTKDYIRCITTELPIMTELYERLISSVGFIAHLKIG